MGVDCGDYDADGKPDIYVTNFSDDYNTLYRNDGSGLFSDVTYRARLGEPTFPYLGWATRFLDVEHDGDLDLFVVNGHIWPEVDRVASGTWYAQSNQLFLNTGEGTFVEASKEAGLVEKRLGRGAAFGDVDEDGDLDVVIANMHALPTLLFNETEGERSLDAASPGRPDLQSGRRRRAGERHRLGKDTDADGEIGRRLPIEPRSEAALRAGCERDPLRSRSPVAVRRDGSAGIPSAPTASTSSSRAKASSIRGDPQASDDHSW